MSPADHASTLTCTVSVSIELDDVVNTEPDECADIDDNTDVSPILSFKHKISSSCSFKRPITPFNMCLSSLIFASTVFLRLSFISNNMRDNSSNFTVSAASILSMTVKVAEELDDDDTAERAPLEIPSRMMFAL